MTPAQLLGYEQGTEALLMSDLQALMSVLDITIDACLEPSYVDVCIDEQTMAMVEAFRLVSCSHHRTALLHVAQEWGVS